MKVARRFELSSFVRRFTGETAGNSACRLFAFVGRIGGRAGFSCASFIDDELSRGTN
jgi:hypothetical protein